MHRSSSSSPCARGCHHCSAPVDAWLAAHTRRSLCWLHGLGLCHVCSAPWRTSGSVECRVTPSVSRAAPRASEAGAIARRRIVRTELRAAGPAAHTYQIWAELPYRGDAAVFGTCCHIWDTVQPRVEIVARTEYTVMHISRSTPVPTFLFFYFPKNKNKKTRRARAKRAEPGTIPRVCPRGGGGWGGAAGTRGLEGGFREAGRPLMCTHVTHTQTHATHTHTARHRAQRWWPPATELRHLPMHRPGPAA